MSDNLHHDRCGKEIHIGATVAYARGGRAYKGRVLDYTRHTVLIERTHPDMWPPGRTETYRCHSPSMAIMVLAPSDASEGILLAGSNNAN